MSFLLGGDRVSLPRRTAAANAYDAVGNFVSHLAGAAEGNLAELLQSVFLTKSSVAVRRLDKTEQARDRAGSEQP
jgi:hypothetical protein